MTALERWIEERLAGRAVALVGVGNRLRGDDGAGPALADRLRRPGAARGEGAARWRVLDAGTVPENFLGPLLEAAPDVVLFADAVDHGGAAGEWVVAAPDALEPRDGGTHAPSLRLVAGLLAAHGIECWLLGVQPGPRAFGEGLTRGVAAAVETMARALEAAPVAEASRA